MVDPVQNLGDSFSCSIEKVFLCTGADGYVPKYNPTNREYGCLADAPSLLYRFKILVGCNKIWGILEDLLLLLVILMCVVLQDKAQPETQASAFGDVSFKAKLAQDASGAQTLVTQPGSDGFMLSSSPLFQVRVSQTDDVQQQNVEKCFFLFFWKLEDDASLRSLFSFPPAF